MVPRIARLREVVDDHQVAFARHLARLGKVAPAETAQDLRDLLDHALRDPSAYRADPQEASGAEAVERAGKLIDELLLAPRARRSLLTRRLRRG
ncbi:hypothetical protein ACFQX6_37865 [Streptosporangium lutulentum]